MSRCTRAQMTLYESMGGSVRGERKWRRARWSEDRASADDARSAGVGGSVCRERKETY